MHRFQPRNSPFALLIAAAALCNGVAHAAPWKTFSPKDAGFTVELPGTPKSERKVDKDADGSVTINQDYTLESDDNLFMVGYQEHEAAFGRLIKPDALLDEVEKSVIKSNGGAVKAQGKIVMATFPGREVTMATADKGTVKLRVLWTGTRLYMMIVAYPNTPRAARDANRAFDSYELLKSQPKSTAPPPKAVTKAVPKS